MSEKCSSFIMQNVHCVYKSESPHRGDSNKYTQYAITFVEDRESLLD